MKFELLGPVRITAFDGRDLTPSAPKMRQLLSLLILRGNEVAAVESIIDELWGATAPPSALQIVQTYVYKLRRVLHSAGGERDRKTCHLVTAPGGYRLAVSPERLDIHEFRNLVRRGELIAATEPAGASEVLAQALLLWRGQPLQGVENGALLSTYVAELVELMLATRYRRLDLDLSLGRHTSLISELRALIAAYPFHEMFHGQLMLALHRSHRRYEALQAYHGLRRMMQDELGLEPVSAIQRLHMRILSSDPGLTWTAPAEHTSGDRVAVPVGCRTPRYAPDPPRPVATGDTAPDRRALTWLPGRTQH